MVLDVSGPESFVDVSLLPEKRKGLNIGGFRDLPVNELENERILDYSEGFSVDVGDDFEELSISTGTVPPVLDLDDIGGIEVEQNPADIGLVVIPEKKKAEILHVCPGKDSGINLDPERDEELEVSLLPLSLADI